MSRRVGVERTTAIPGNPGFSRSVFANDLPASGPFPGRQPEADQHALPPPHHRRSLQSGCADHSLAVEHAIDGRSAVMAMHFVNQSSRTGDYLVVSRFLDLGATDKLPLDPIFSNMKFIPNSGDTLALTGYDIDARCQRISPSTGTTVR